MLIDYHTAQRQQFIRDQSSHAGKLAAAIQWLRSRNSYALDRYSTFRYTPAQGHPMPVVGGGK